MSDFETDDIPCPACGNPVTHSDDCQDCDEVGEQCECPDDICQGIGRCIHGDGMVACRTCHGTEIRRWCPSCGLNYWAARQALSEEGRVEHDKKLAKDW